MMMTTSNGTPKIDCKASAWRHYCHRGHFVRVKNCTPAFSKGDGKQMALLTMQAIREKVVKLELESDPGAKAIISELERFTEDPVTTMSLPTIYQVSGRNIP